MKEEIEEILYEEEVEKKSGLLSKSMLLQLKKNSLSWNEDKSKDGSSKNYILLFTITKVETIKTKITVKHQHNIINKRLVALTPKRLNSRPSLKKKHPLGTQRFKTN